MNFLLIGPNRIHLEIKEGERSAGVPKKWFGRNPSKKFLVQLDLIKD